jgi:hypothetical protein
VPTNETTISAPLSFWHRRKTVFARVIIADLKTTISAPADIFATKKDSFRAGLQNDHFSTRCHFGAEERPFSRG